MLRKQTRCSTWRMRIPDKNYDAMRLGRVQKLIKAYRENSEVHIEEEWDCDDIARDFWSFAKEVIKVVKEGNGIVGMVDFPDHTQIVYVEEINSKSEPYHVYYFDQRDWSIHRPNRKPKWIIM